MNLATILVLAIALSMDAFAVSICKGLAMKKLTISKCMVVGAWFGIFQGMMPFIGYLLGVSFESVIEKVSAWIAFILLAVIGGNMVKESFSKEEEESSDSLGVKEMFLLAVATSIDALAVGVTFACVNPVIAIGLSPLLNTTFACIIICCTTFLISAVGVKIGSIFGTKYKSKAELCGGIVLILIGLKIIIEHFIG